MTERRRAVGGLGQVLVYWLWAFVFFMAGLGSVLSRTASAASWNAQLTRIVLLSVGGAALLVCSRNLWAELTAMRQGPRSPTSPPG